MNQLIVDYDLGNLTPANPDGTVPANVSGCTLVNGPGATVLGNLDKALEFGSGASLTAELPIGALDRVKFTVRTAFRIDQAPVATQVLVCSPALPFRLAIEPGSDGSAFHLVASVDLVVPGAGRVSSRWHATLELDKWYTADLAYDTDTLGLFIDGIIRSVRAFPVGALATGSGNLLSVGVAADGSQDQYSGAMAALQVHADIPIELEAQIDERRTHPEWFLTYRTEELRPQLSLGTATGPYVFDLSSAAWLQEFTSGTLMYADAIGHAFELHGAIRQAYWALPDRGGLGYLISDELGTAKVGGRKSLFSRGGLYWSPATGARPVTGEIWVDYEGLGESGALGWPVAAAEPVPGGHRQRFQGGTMYHRSGQPRAFEVHGAILARFLAAGEVSAWGFPIGNEVDVLEGNNAIGRSSEFETVTCYWSSGSGACEVHGDIRTVYRGCGGPSGNLGFPTSDEGDVPGAAGARFNTFEHGSVVWFGSIAETYICEVFDINIGRFDTKESEGFGRGSNDVYVQVGVEDNGSVILSQRFPGSGDSDGQNVFTVSRTLDFGPNGIVPNRADCVIKLTMDVWDSDWPDDDDHLGYFEYVLEMANAWGLRGNRLGLFNTGSFSHINSITWSVSPRVNEVLLDDNQRWWGIKNQGTNPLTWNQYSAAFTDVDSDTEWWDPADWLAKLFYEVAVEGLAKSGNCFGMSLEAIYSYKHRSILRLPLDRFDQWEPVRNEFNIKHQYQVGASAIWWFAGQFLSGNTHDPVDVFHETRSAHARGCDPVLCISQNYDFSGKPHCILPVAWDDSSKPWRLLVHDPNFPSPNAPALQTVLVDPDANTFTYNGKSSYSGGEWSGGRMHYMPYSVVCDQPRTPVFEALMLLMSGAILIVGADGETVSLTDENGVSLDAFGADAIGKLQSGQSVADKFVSIKGFADHTDHCAKERTGTKPVKPGFDGHRRPQGLVAGEVHLHSRPPQTSRRVPPNRRTGTDWTRLTLREYICQWAPARIRRALASDTSFVAANEGRLMIHLLHDSAFTRVMREAAHLPVEHAFAAASGAGNGIATISSASATGNFIHTLRGARRGELHYAFKHGLTEVLISGESIAGDELTLQIRDIGTHTNTVTVESSRDKYLSIVMQSRIGVGHDQLRLKVDKLAISAGQKMDFNFRPGLGGLDIVCTDGVRARVTLELLRKGKVFSGKFDLESERGLRVFPSTFIAGTALKMAQIDQIFGASQRTMLVPST